MPVNAGILTGFSGLTAPRERRRAVFGTARLQARSFGEATSTSERTQQAMRRLRLTRNAQARSRSMLTGGGVRNVNIRKHPSTCPGRPGGRTVGIRRLLRAKPGKTGQARGTSEPPRRDRPRTFPAHCHVEAVAVPQDFNIFQKRRSHSVSCSSIAPHGPARRRGAAWPRVGPRGKSWNIS